MSINRKLTSQSHNPTVVRDVERQIHREAKNEEIAIKHAIKDLEKTEKEEGKAYKHTLQAEHNVEKSESREQSTLKKMYKAQHTHDLAVSDLNNVQNDYQMQAHNHERLVDQVSVKKQEVETCMKVNEERTRERNEKLTALHAPATDSDEEMRATPTNAPAMDQSHLGMANATTNAPVMDQSHSGMPYGATPSMDQARPGMPYAAPAMDQTHLAMPNATTDVPTMNAQPNGGVV